MGGRSIGSTSGARCGGAGAEEADGCGEERMASPLTGAPDGGTVDGGDGYDCSIVTSESIGTSLSLLGGTTTGLALNSAVDSFCCGRYVALDGPAGVATFVLLPASLSLLILSLSRSLSLATESTYAPTSMATPAISFVRPNVKDRKDSRSDVVHGRRLSPGHEGER